MGCVRSACSAMGAAFAQPFERDNTPTTHLVSDTPHELRLTTDRSPFTNQDSPFAIRHSPSALSRCFHHRHGLFGDNLIQK